MSKVADFIETKRRLTIFQIFYAIIHLIPNRFLDSQNDVAFDYVRSRILPITQQFLNNYYNYHPNYSILPQPILPLQPIAKQLYPWTLFEYVHNIKSKSLWLPQHTLIDLIHLPLFGLKQIELTSATSEYINTQVMLQNIDDIINERAASNYGGRVLRYKQVNFN